MVGLLDLAVLAITRWNSSRLWWALVWPLTALLIPLVRALLRRALKRFSLWQLPTVVVGTGPNAHEAAEA